MRLPAVLTATAGTPKPLAAACRFAPANVSVRMWLALNTVPAGRARAA